MRTLDKIVLLTLLISLFACDSDNNTKLLTINFEHTWNNETVSSTDFNQSKYTNAHGEILSISKLRYLISNLELHNSNGESIQLKDYILIDLSNNENLSFTIPIPDNNYSNLSFVFGFDEENNIDGYYTDLNSESWNWPQMLGGGYHFLQFEGKYESGGIENPFLYHMGTARVSDGVFEQNNIDILINDSNKLNKTEINIEMNISEWFKNPIIWDLHTYDINLMPNYDAQKMMSQNGKTAFSLRGINE